MFAVIICRSMTEPNSMEINTWLMSRRVLGRGVSEASMNLLAKEARKKSISMLHGRYIPTTKNGMVADQYKKLGFEFNSRAQTQ